MIFSEEEVAGDFSDFTGCENALGVKRETKIRIVSWNLPGGPAVNHCASTAGGTNLTLGLGRCCMAEKLKKKKRIVSSVLGLYAFYLFSLHSDFLQGIS